MAIVDSPKIPEYGEHCLDSNLTVGLTDPFAELTDA